MSYYGEHSLRNLSDDLSYDIEKAYARHGVNIEIVDSSIQKDRIIFEVKPKKDTREANIIARANEVQLRLKLPLFHVFKENLTIFIAVSKSKIKSNSLLKILANPKYLMATRKLKLPYVVGHKVTGELLIADLFLEKHMMMGGATGSGKSVALKNLILSIILGKPPSKVNLILIDVGANDLMPFDGIPHLSGPVARDKETALQYLIALEEEMERRMELEYSNPDEFNLLPSLVIVIDEFPALISGMGDKELSKQIVGIMSNLLNRGRHTDIHMVLAAQNPTLQNIKVDLGNITTRMAFKCAKRNFSETIIGEAGAEHLTGKGDMYFKSLQYGLVRIQGVFISPHELKWSLSQLKILHLDKDENSFVLPDIVSHEADYDHAPVSRLITAKQHTDDMIFAEVMIWVLGHNEVSCNSLMKRFKVGWNKANGFLERLNRLGIVSDVFATLPRVVHTASHNDLSDEVIEFLQLQGYTTADIAEVLNSKSVVATQFGIGTDGLGLRQRNGDD